MSIKLYKTNILFLLYLSVFYQFCSANPTVKPLSHYVKICRRHDPNLNECVQDSVMTLKPHLIKGIKELEIPSCEPLVIPNIKLVQGQGKMTLKSEYKNVQLNGFSNFTLYNVNVNVDKNLIEFEANIPKLKVKSNYSVDGKIFLLPIKGDGLCHANYSDVDFKVKLILEKTKINNEEFMHCKDFYLKMNIHKAEINLEDLFNGDKVLGKVVNDFLNRHWEDILEELQPTLEQMMIDYFKDYANGFFKKYPLSVLLPEN